MIQRKQTLFLILAFVLMVVCMSTQLATLVGNNGIAFANVYNLWLTDGQGSHSLTSAPLFVMLLLSALLSLVTIFMYMKRKLQAKLCVVQMFVLLGWYVFLAVLPQYVGGQMNLRWPVVLPAVCIILTFMARKGIVADEKLVRSLDRIR